jgi:hypothetical protein
MAKPLLPERPMAPAVFHILIALADRLTTLRSNEG